MPAEARAESRGQVVFFSLLVLKGVIAIVLLLGQQGQWGFRGCQRERHLFLLFFGQPDVLGRTRGWWRGLWTAGCVCLSLVPQALLQCVPFPITHGLGEVTWLERLRQEVMKFLIILVS